MLKDFSAFMSFALLVVHSMTSCSEKNDDQEQYISTVFTSSNYADKGYLQIDSETVEIVFERETAHALLGGDIRIPLTKIKKKRSRDGLELSVANETIQTWPAGRVPYTAPVDFPFVDELNYAISEWARAGISWVPRTASDVDYVAFEARLSEKYCGFSDLGRSGNAQKIAIATVNFASGARCNMRYTLLHEMAHALGFMHEHQRSDRDMFVAFDSPIPNGSAHLFYRIAREKQHLTAFDLSSVTMYGSEMTKPRIRTKDGRYIPLRETLSHSDIEGTKLLYLKPGECRILSKRGSVLYGPRGIDKLECLELCERIASHRLQPHCFWGRETLVPKI